MKPNTPAHTRHDRHGTKSVALAVSLIAAVCVTALGYVGFMLWPKWPEKMTAADAPSLPVSVAGVAFNVPPGAMRVATQRNPGPQPRLDLVFHWPDLTPPDAAAKPSLSDDLKPNHLFVTITGPQGTLPLNQRIRTIYPRYTVGGAFEGPEGLTGVAFRDGTPYQGEDLLFDMQQPEKFLVRCTRQNGPTAGTCLLERHVSGAEITVRFPREWLKDWRELAAGADGLVARLRSSQPQS